ncbi:shikimate dehydrogenase [Caldimonas brevitalea]|uniref:Shikimate dehydrogenase (NADP(+)) n=1 Tax=Caldimonas brevitalea TaxID=413882 RepID=A0A0G3BMH7_9BURK|nr:shikimate dehydrogenase [Caldimonas brevitalea]AKJ27755.1 shikimate dehydrogenase [Caldimonas brevitalea]
MDRYAVAGNPVEHSKSPDIHARFAAQTGQALTYERLLVPLDRFETTLRAFAASGAKGCNVTVPFKFEACRAAHRVSERARLAQAANVLCFEPQGGWFADNTDGSGLVADLRHNAGVDLAGRDLLLIGAGGAAAGVLAPLIDLRPRRVVVANRTLHKAQALVQTHAAWAAERDVTLQASGLEDCGSGYALVLNATASSLQGGGVPVAGRVLGPGALAYDMMYGPAAAGFLEWAAEHGASGRDGLGMLVEQAADAFALWRGVRPETTEVLAALRRGEV